MNAHCRMRVNAPGIVHETIDGETIILNLESGNYYSLLGVGADIWRFIDNGARLSDIVEKLHRDYESDSDVETALAEFVSELVREGLIISDETGTPAGVAWSDERNTTGSNGERRRFERPVLNKYNDMQALLLLDPIHNVDEETGWSARKTSWPTNNGRIEDQ